MNNFLNYSGSLISVPLHPIKKIYNVPIRNSEIEGMFSHGLA
jgi:hypothetical protein